MRYNIFIYSLIIILLSGCNSPSKLDYDLVIRNVNLIDGSGKQLQENVSIGVKDGRIISIDSDSTIMGKDIIDGTDKYLMPGLFDCHVHTGNFQQDFQHFIHYGVTSIFIPGGITCTNEYYESMRELGGQDSIPAPRVFHTSQHFTMKGRHPAKTYGGNRKHGENIFYLKDTNQIESIVRQVAQYPILGIKITIEDGPSPPFVERIPQEFVNKTVKEASKY